MDDKVLDYHDVLLRRGDVEVLTGPHWLNDQTISFFFEYLAQEEFQGLQSQLLLLEPATAYLLAQSSSDVARAILQPLRAAERQLVLLPVSDNPNVEAAGGGSHWSLLAFVGGGRGVYLHYDSLSGCNAPHARALARVLQPVLGGGGYREAAAPRQQNGYDCGLYAAAFARLLCARLAAEGAQGMGLEVSASDVPPEDAAALRGEMHRLILERAERQHAAAAGGQCHH